MFIDLFELFMILFITAKVLFMNFDSILKFLLRKFPNSKINFFGEGWTSAAFLVDNKILRFPKTETVTKSYEREIKILNLVRHFTDTPVPDPKMCFDCEFKYVEHLLLPGNHWDISNFDSMQENIQDALVKDSAAFLFQVHSTNLNLAQKN